MAKNKSSLRDKYYNSSSRLSRGLGIFIFLFAIIMFAAGIGELRFDMHIALNLLGFATFLLIVSALEFWVWPKYYQYLRNNGTLVERSGIIKKDFFLFKKFK